MRYIISEKQEALILSKLMEERLNEAEANDKVLRIKDYLDKGFKKVSQGAVDSNGDPSKAEMVLMIGYDGTPVRPLDDKQLFQKLQAKIKNILPEDERDEFLKKCMIAWYYGKITRNGTIIT
jgi:hypothetical protein